MNAGKATRSYIAQLLPESTALEAELEDYAERNSIPIMDKEGMHTLLKIIEISQPDKILEIGTAIGYSAIRMLHAVPKAKVVSVERDTVRASLAKEYISRAHLSDRFILIEGDALETYEKVAGEAPYDVLFIDAAKGQYEKFFRMFEPLVKENGLILSDNVLFQGYVAGEREPESKRIKSMVKKIDAFNQSVMKDPSFSSALLPVGDGLLVTRKCKTENT